MIAYLSYFSTSFILAMVLWPLLSAVLTLPILAGLYHRHHRLHSRSVLIAYLCVLYALGLITFTLYPMPDDPQTYCLTHSHGPQLNPFAFVGDLTTSGKTAAFQLLFNVALFLPLGFALCRWGRWKWYAAVPAGFLVSLFIETSQLTGFWHIYPCAYRQFDVDDLLTNTLGAVLGCLVARVYGHFVPLARVENRDEVNHEPGLLHRAVSLVIDMVFVSVVDVALTLGFIYCFSKLAAPLLRSGSGGPFGGSLLVVVSDVGAKAFTLISLLIFEVWIPMRHRGQTLGGMFTHMSCETKERHGGARFAFYAVRLVVLFVAMQVTVDSSRKVALALIVALVVFWIFAHQMPYDFISGRKWSGDDEAGEVGHDTGEVAGGGEANAGGMVGEVGDGPKPVDK
ncbi:VanZ family protein [Bifidobacterium sp. ESL0790]|uniref:VanZ family protein n=1 Tax=Bifidobacterium sp. ESL0790 TaxID=2983233 RepID=UPI0023F8D417|nr:VanZ family protein [Bifidobacterium sp. ESL0790]WEV72433.1 VanZ family protein [Bifidobacterium sp. ESL0790]